MIVLATERDKSKVGHNGKLIPLDLDTQEPHICTNRPVKRDKCRICHEEIYLDWNKRNPANGRMIPQDTWGNHRCKTR
jgi:hypothetical protein